MRETRRWQSAAATVVMLGLLSGAPRRATGQGGASDSAAQSAEVEEAKRLNQQVEKLTGEAKYTEALPVAERALAIRERAFGAEHPDVAESLNHLAELYSAKGDYARAEPLHQRALAIREKALGAEHTSVATSLNNLGVLYRAKGDYARAEPLHQRALATREKALGAEHPDVAQSLSNLAALYWSKGDYVRVEPLHQRALAIREKALGTEHPAVAESLSHLAAIYRNKGDYARAEPMFQRALGIREKALGAEHPDVAQSLSNLAAVYEARLDYVRAELLFQRALAIWEKALGGEHHNVASSLLNVGRVYEAKNDYVKAEPLYQRALAIYEKSLGAKHPLVATALNSLALLYEAKGDYVKAELLYQRTLAIREEVLGAEHTDVATALNNLAVLYRLKGDYGRAELLYQRALAIREKALGAEHPDVAQSLNNLAALYWAKRDYVSAEPLHLRALAIWEKSLGAEHTTVATALHNLALLFRDRGDYMKAEPLFQRALAIFEKLLGAEHSSVATNLQNLALLYQAKGDYVRAESLYERSLAIFEKTLGAEHPSVATNLHNRARLYTAKGDSTLAIELQKRASDIRERNLALILTTGSENQKRSYLATLVGETDVTVSLHIHSAPNDPQAARLALTTILRRKGRLLDAMSDQIGALRRRLSVEDRALLEQFSAARTQLATLVLKGPGRSERTQHQAAVAKLSTEVEQLESSVSRRSAEFRTQVQPVTLEAVQEAIPQGTALVEVFLYRPFNPKAAKKEETFGAARYVVYVLGREGAPRFVELGEAAPIDTAVRRLRAALVNPARPDVKAEARALDDRVMRPVRRLLGDTRRLLLSPDGELNLLPFSALVDEQDRYAVENYTATYLTSGRDLLRLAVPTASRQGPVMIANPSFDLALSASGQSVGGEPTGGERSVDFAQVRFAQLPGTATEAQALRRILPGVKVLTEAAATERALKQVTGPSLLHVATHGFFLPDQEQSGENPLLRSGLLLAGANGRHDGAGEDGILTALEAAGLDLWGTRLVVLSACKTAVGDVRNGEGVYGLRRALVLAGSESQVMSLWQVSDQATRDLMVEYYKRLHANEGRTEALRQAQLKMIRTKERRHPFYWASFIQSGAWKNLEGIEAGAK